jgi:hypothetical protein
VRDQLELEDQLQRAQSGQLVAQVVERLGDQPLGIGGTQSLFRSSSFLPITMRWISEVPSPISSSGASR